MTARQGSGVGRKIAEAIKEELDKNPEMVNSFKEGSGIQVFPITKRGLADLTNAFGPLVSRGQEPEDDAVE